MRRDPFGFPLAGEWPAIDAAGMAEVDRLMIEDYGIETAQMMENAGRALATLAWKGFLARGKLRRVTILAGSGGNGGGALTAARRLACWGADLAIVLAQDTSAMAPVSTKQLRILERMGLRPVPFPPSGADLIVDGLIGYSLHGAPRGRAAELIDLANASPTPVLSLDVPSGFDATSGQDLRPSIQATATLTLALPKAGLASCAATGDLYLADISVPPDLYRRLAPPLKVGRFNLGEILRVL
ncbi:MAG: NAD(P)H-hydrate epimerase [Rhodobacteraceae bacterium]|nr:NAD(P)H-hydrate epimerase [Paracoccaceae bacterium]